MINTIYALVEIESRTKFYIGFTSRDPVERFKEHKYGAKTCGPKSEDKYKYASALDALGIEWTLEVITTADITDEYSENDTEDYYINLFRREPLQNMRAGMQQAWMGNDYLNIDEFLKAKKRYLDRAKIKTERVKKESDVNKMLYSFENPQKKFVSPAYEALAKRSRK